VYLPGVAGGDAIAKETGLDFFSVPIELGVRPLMLNSYWLTHADSLIALRRRESPQYPRRDR